ncbi:MAG: response regulator transcription factor [Alicyclobacillus sp.]|nr:response regulator transcription factor [Alicyclobacillus sp.]
MTDKGPRTPTVLIVDDEESIQKLVDYNFRRVGFRTEVLSRGDEAYERVKTDPASLDIVILDIMLPGMDGMEVCKRLRQEQIKLPIILLTARDEEIDRVLGLELGADDYVTKPFSLRELAARIKAVLRRAGGREPHRREAIKIRDLEIDLDGREVRSKGRKIDLTPTEFKILSVLAGSPGRVYSRLQLLDAAFGYAYEGYERSIDTHVSNLRKKIEPDPANPEYIVTVYGTGYRLRK